MTTLEIWLCAVVAVLWILGGDAVVTGITINENKRQRAGVKFALFMIWPVAWLFVMFTKKRRKASPS